MEFLFRSQLSKNNISENSAITVIAAKKMPKLKCTLKKIRNNKILAFLFPVDPKYERFSRLYVSSWSQHENYGRIL